CLHPWNNPMKISVFIGPSRCHDPWLKISRPRGCEEDYPFLSRSSFEENILCIDSIKWWKNYPFLSIPSRGQYSWKKMSGFIDPVANEDFDPINGHYPSKQTIHSYLSHCKMVVILKRTNSFYRPCRDPSKKISIPLNGNYPLLSIPLQNGHDPSKMSDLIDPSKKVSVLIDPIEWLRSLGEVRYPVFSIPSNGRDLSKKISIPLNVVRSYRSFEVDIRSDQFHQMVLILRKRYPVLSIPLQMVAILGRIFAVIDLDVILRRYLSIPSSGRDSWKKNSFHRFRRDPSKVLIDPIKWSRFLEEYYPFLSIPLQMVAILGRIFA
ncbi:14283_t:CDS:2, partial [Funneliformis geosporum]